MRRIPSGGFAAAAYFPVDRYPGLCLIGNIDRPAFSCDAPPAVANITHHRQPMPQWHTMPPRAIQYVPLRKVIRCEWILATSLEHRTYGDVLTWTIVLDSSCHPSGLAGY